VSLGLMACQQLSGINFVLSYSVQIFKDAGTDIDENLSSILVALVQVVGTGLAIVIVDRFGRKILLFLSAFLMCVAHCALGVYFYLKDHATADEMTSTTLLPTTTAAVVGGPNVTAEPPQPFITESGVKDLAVLPLVSLMLLIAGFAVGFGPLPWVMNVELFSAEARVSAGAMCGSFNWLVSYTVVSLVPLIQEATNAYVCYFLFSGLMLVATLFVVFLTPETKGKSEEEIKKYFL